MMSNTNSASSSKVVASDDWVTDTKNMVKYEVGETPVCIHKVRHGIRAISPEVYTPQYISLGPYHHSRGDLYEMLAYKVLAFKNSQMSACQNKQEVLERLVEDLKSKHIIARIRASYDRHLKEDGDTLAWIMVLDSIFLLQFLLEHMHQNRSCLSRMKRTSHLVDRTESAYHSILQDIMMFENQIPIFVLYHILQSPDIGIEANLLPLMLLNTCKELCPLKYDETKLRPEITKYAHLLELKYYMIVPEQQYNDDDRTEPLATKNQQKRPRNCVPNNDDVLSCNSKMLGNIRVAPHCKLWKFILKIIGLVISVVLKQGGEEVGTDPENASGGLSSTSDKEAPKVEEIQIPTVSRLLHVGIKFCCTNDPITSLKFDIKTQTFHLPPITINANTEVVIRNLVAYKAEAISGPLVLARYTELMSGIIDTAKDVKLLRKKKILVSYLKNDEDVAQLWNNMSRSIRLSRVTFIDKAIKEVNEVYSSKIRVKFVRFTKECMDCGWRFLMLLLAIVLMVLMLIQSFCDVYNCPRALAPVPAPSE